MATEDGLLNVHKPGKHFCSLIVNRLILSAEVVLWLWRGHNKVNKRLKGEASEDPHFPKQQFPPKELCPECRDSAGSFDEEKVLQFLIRYYSDVRTDNYKV